MGGEGETWNDLRVLGPLTFLDYKSETSPGHATWGDLDEAPARSALAPGILP